MKKYPVVMTTTNDGEISASLVDFPGITEIGIFPWEISEKLRELLLKHLRASLGEEEAMVAATPMSSVVNDKQYDHCWFGSVTIKVQEIRPVKEADIVKAIIMLQRAGLQVVGYYPQGDRSDINTLEDLQKYRAVCDTQKLELDNCDTQTPEESEPNGQEKEHRAV